MKTIKISITIIFLALLVSCSEEFLNLPKEHEASSATYFEKEVNFRSALIGAYAPLRTVYGGRNYLAIAEMRSDNAHYEYYLKLGGQDHGDYMAITDFLDGAVNLYTNDVFNACFSGIARTNTIISRMTDLIPENSKNEILAETKFLRAFYYFTLVRFFGEVPLHIQEVKSEQLASKPKSPVNEIYNLIFTDLDFARKYLKKVDKFPQTGKATLGAALALQASAYIFRKEFDKAIPLLNEILDHGYDLNTEYTDAFKTSNKNGKESVFDVQFTEGTQNLHSTYIYHFLPKSLDNKSIIGLANANNISIGGVCVPTEDLINDYEPNDKRFYATIGVVEGIMEGDNFKSTALKSIIGFTPVNGVPYRLFCRKYLNPHTTAFQTGDNWPVFRFADVLLMLAECYNETNNPALALPFLNKVRHRAGLTDILVTDKNQLQSIICMNEE
ncbi:MAG: RagB/SusD family nutrient uptake outer membrane protein [Bacteroidales bacterium]|nr:RagB/SusD family nutrient uptake outer membrane protein [Bacteroidales bacterium]